MAGRAPHAVGALVATAALLVVGVGARQVTDGTPLPAERAARVMSASSAATTFPSRTSTTTTSRPAPAPPPVTVAAPPPAPALPPVTTPAPEGDCGAALAYLAAHEAPGFVATCGPGTAFGHYGVACWNAVDCPDGQKIIHIACPLPFVYMNEAHNSWTLVGGGSGIDPHGQGTPAEQSYCNRLR
jgi:hypothetical protein